MKAQLVCGEADSFTSVSQICCPSMEHLTSYIAISDNRSMPYVEQ